MMESTQRLVYKRGDLVQSYNRLHVIQWNDLNDRSEGSGWKALGRPENKNNDRYISISDEMSKSVHMHKPDRCAARGAIPHLCISVRCASETRGAGAFASPPLHFRSAAAHKAAHHHQSPVAAVAAPASRPSAHAVGAARASPAPLPWMMTFDVVPNTRRLRTSK
jgi:hypothetical protein